MSYELTGDPTVISDESSNRLRKGVIVMIARKVIINGASGIAEHVGDEIDLEFGYVPGWVELREQLKAEKKSIREVLASTPPAVELQGRFTDADQVIQERTSEGRYDAAHGWRARNVLAAAGRCVQMCMANENDASPLSFEELRALALANMFLEDDLRIVEGQQSMANLDQMRQDSMVAGEIATAAYIESAFNRQILGEPGQTS